MAFAKLPPGYSAPDRHPITKYGQLKVQNSEQMRAFWILTFFSFLLIGCQQSAAPDVPQANINNLEEALDQMSEPEQVAVLYYAQHLSAGDTEKEINRLWKQLSDEERVELIAFATNTDKMAPSFFLELASSFRTSSRVQRIGESSKQKPAQTRNASEGPLAEMELDHLEHDFGRILDYEVVRHTFKFTNTGEAPLLIEEVSGTCGCTAPTWTTEPIAPGESGTVEVEYNPAGKSGRERQALTITANTRTTPIRIFVLADVVSAEK